MATRNQRQRRHRRRSDKNSDSDGSGEVVVQTFPNGKVQAVFLQPEHQTGNRLLSQSAQAGEQANVTKFRRNKRKGRHGRRGQDNNDSDGEEVPAYTPPKEKVQAVQFQPEHQAGNMDHSQSAQAGEEVNFTKFFDVDKIEGEVTEDDLFLSRAGFKQRLKGKQKSKELKEKKNFVGSIVEVDPDLGKMFWIPAQSTEQAGWFSGEERKQWMEILIRINSEAEN